MQFSLAQMLILVGAVAVGLTAILFSTPWIASVAYTLYLSGLCFAIAGLIANRGAARLFWLGAAIFGGAYFVAAFRPFSTGPDQHQSMYYYAPSYYYADNGSAPDVFERSEGFERPLLVTTRLLDALAQWRAKELDVGSHVLAKWMGGGYFWGHITAVNQATKYLVQWDDGTTPSEVTADKIRQSDQKPIGVGAKVDAEWMYGSYFPGRVTQVMPGPSLMYTVAWDDRSSPSEVDAKDVQRDIHWARKTGHAVFGLLIGVLGGWFVWGFFRMSQRG